MEGTDYSALWGSLQARSRLAELGMDALERKRTGSYYTDMELTDRMMHELVSHLGSGSKPIYRYRYLEPCVGAGNFVFSYLKEVKGLGIGQKEAALLLDNIYVADINRAVLKTYAESLREAAYLFWGVELGDSYFRSHIGTGLLVDVTAKELDYIPIRKVFAPEAVKDGFDIVVTNPPYKNLKAERGHYASGKEYELDKGKYASISEIVRGRFQYSVGGGLNLYKLFVEEIIDRYAAEQAYISLLVPASILSDKTCAKLRTHILTGMELRSVKIIGESNGYLDAQQALSALLIRKGGRTKNVTVVKDFCRNPEEAADIKIGDILNGNTGNAIFAITKEEYGNLRKLREFPVVKELGFLKNLRGELDLTADKKYITPKNSGYRLLRGRNIAYYSLTDTGTDEFVSAEFVGRSKKGCYVQRERLICQQVANMHKERRVTFALAPKNCVLGNSCNFIAVDENEYGIDIYALLGLLNTKIINWLFKLTSSNNHVNNYEIDGFPVPVGSPYLQQISALVRIYLESKEDFLLGKIEALARAAYGLGSGEEELHREKEGCAIAYYQDMRWLLPSIPFEMAEKILKGKASILQYLDGLSKFECNVVEGITEKYANLYRGAILNHTTFKLSGLDLEMIRAVPQGGNWKDIPMETVEKSKRLKKIAQTGGRTTLYGRIDYSKPSYTITTYFNRPGNGTYVHPVHERVLSVREAARFQTFRDSYFFFGNKTQLLKQVGNAVPTLLAYQIAKEIKEKTGCMKSVDLFCGAGGMAAGFKAAGILCVLGNDIEESACTTFKINHPEIPVLCGDITQRETRDIIGKAAENAGADIICGGPPCQGFSMAGFRLEDDPRNQLFREFVDVVKRVNPKVIVFENVEGLLSYQGGKTYREVHALFSELGYHTEGRTLMANEYAVPQKRKRVIIICTRKDIGVMPVELFPKPITESEERQVTAWETISDLEQVACGEEAKYMDTGTSDILKFFKGQVSYGEFIAGRAVGSHAAGEESSLVVGDGGQLAWDIFEK